MGKSRTCFLIGVCAVTLLAVSLVGAKLDRRTLAVVNGHKITGSYLEKRLKNLPETYKSTFTNRKDELLEQLVVERILLQEAEKRGLSTRPDAPKEGGSAEMALIRKLFADVTASVLVEDAEIRKFYDANKQTLPSNPFERLKNDIREYLLAQKQNEAFNDFATRARAEADVVLNESWVKAQQSAKPKDPLAGVLGNGKPSVVDFGASTCVPCKMMKPIFDELTKEHRGKANILLIEIYDHRNLATQYGIRAIPTQVFFDRNGKEVWRHQGFLPKEDIVKKLKELGA
jgi:thioredoxin 1